ELLDRQPAVLGEQGRLRATELLGQLGDRGGLVGPYWLVRHVPPLSDSWAGTTAARKRGTPRRRAHGAKGHTARRRPGGHGWRGGLASVLPARAARVSGTFDRAPGDTMTSGLWVELPAR